MRNSVRIAVVCLLILLYVTLAWAMVDWTFQRAAANWPVEPWEGLLLYLYMVSGPFWLAAVEMLWPGDVWPRGRRPISRRRDSLARRWMRARKRPFMPLRLTA